MNALPTTLLLRDEAASTDLAQRLAPILRAGDVLLLRGQIGAGKSFFARALIRHLAGAQIEVPSPTYTLVQTYDLPGLEVWHADLYRLSDPEEVVELGLTEAFDTALCLVEWPDALGPYRPDTALTLDFEVDGEGRRVTINGAGPWPDRLHGALSHA